MAVENAHNMFDPQAVIRFSGFKVPEILPKETKLMKHWLEQKLYGT
jgi:hypothetical protein